MLKVKTKIDNSRSRFKASANGTFDDLVCESATVIAAIAAEIIVNDPELQKMYFKSLGDLLMQDDFVKILEEETNGRNNN